MITVVDKIADPEANRRASEQIERSAGSDQNMLSLPSPTFDDIRH